MRISLDSLRQFSKNRPASPQELSDPGCRVPVPDQPLSEISDSSAPDLLAQKLLQALQTNPDLVKQLVAMLAPPAAAPQKPDGMASSIYQASVQGNGAIAQGSSSQAAGTGGVSAGGGISGTVMTGHNSRVVHTGGGAYVEGEVSTGGGDFVGRDQAAPQ